MSATLTGALALQIEGGPFGTPADTRLFVSMLAAIPFERADLGKVFRRWLKRVPGNPIFGDSIVLEDGSVVRPAGGCRAAQQIDKDEARQLARSSSTAHGKRDARCRTRRWLGMAMIVFGPARAEGSTYFFVSNTWDSSRRRHPGVERVLSPGTAASAARLEERVATAVRRLREQHAVAALAADEEAGLVTSGVAPGTSASNVNQNGAI